MDGIARTATSDGSARLAASRLGRHRRRDARCPGGGQGPGRRRSDRVAARAVRGGAGADRGRRHAADASRCSASTARRSTSARRSSTLGEAQFDPVDHDRRRRRQPRRGRPAVRRRGHPEAPTSTWSTGGVTVAADARPAHRGGGRHRARPATPCRRHPAWCGAAPAERSRCDRGAGGGPVDRGRRPGRRLGSRRARRRVGAGHPGDRSLVHPGARSPHAGDDRTHPQRRLADRGRPRSPSRCATSGSPSRTRRRSRPGRYSVSARYAIALPSTRGYGSSLRAPALHLRILELHRRRVRLIRRRRPATAELRRSGPLRPARGRRRSEVLHTRRQM